MNLKSSPKANVDNFNAFGVFWGVGISWEHSYEKSGWLQRSVLAAALAISQKPSLFSPNSGTS